MEMVFVLDGPHALRQRAAHSLAPIATVQGTGVPAADLARTDATVLPPRGAPV